MTGPFRLQVNGTTVAEIEVAATWARRLRGMLGRRQLPVGLWLEPERSVHGAAMRVPLDVAVLDRDGRVLAVLVLRPWRATRPRTGGVAVLEAPQGSFERWGLVPGSVVRRVPLTGPQSG